jgi:MAF protein
MESALERHLIPVSVKTRLGYDRVVVDEWIQTLIDEAPAVISVHGRTLKQKYNGNADWNAIARAVEIAKRSRTLILGNGDLKDMADVDRRVRQTQVDGVLLGRSAQGNPWIFRAKDQVKEALRSNQAFDIHEAPISLKDRFKVILEHASHFERCWGSQCFVGMRKHLAWYCRSSPRAAELRARMVRLNSVDEVLRCLRDYAASFADDREFGNAAFYDHESRPQPFDVMRIILASTSPRRREILALLGLPFETIAPTFAETVSSHRPVAEEVLDFAFGKAQSVASDNPESIVIGSDTMILLHGQKIGKPDGIDHAKQILRALAGKTHRIFTSVVIVDEFGGPGLKVVEQVSVRMRSYSEAEIEQYLACNESLDKAGGYSIQGQGRTLIQSIDGDYLAAVGLPLKPIVDYLNSRGISFPLNTAQLYTDKSFLNWHTL